IRMAKTCPHGSPRPHGSIRPHGQKLSAMQQQCCCPKLPHKNKKGIRQDAFSFSIFVRFLTFFHRCCKP
ncbi:MAG: hypothetical protein ACI3YI_00915, partial [Bacteroidaceae bacterium]